MRLEGKGVKNGGLVDAETSIFEGDMFVRMA